MSGVRHSAGRLSLHQIQRVQTRASQTGKAPSGHLSNQAYKWLKEDLEEAWREWGYVGGAHPEVDTVHARLIPLYYLLKDHYINTNFPPDQIGNSQSADHKMRAKRERDRQLRGFGPRADQFAASRRRLFDEGSEEDEWGTRRD